MTPSWCEENNCQCLCSMDTLGGGQCIGKLDVPIDHITPKANTMQWCHYNKVTRIIQPFYINKEDLIVACFIIGEALKKQELGLPMSIVANLPKEV